MSAADPPSAPGAGTPGALEVVAVALRADHLPGGGLARVLDDLAAELGEAHGPRLVFLPPLCANFGALDAGAAGQDLHRAVRAAAARRPLRAALVRLTYPEAHRGRRPWLVMHDRVHATLREVIGAFARRTASTVVGGTALLDHPRRHWEAWPDRGNLFHAAWCFDPGGEPFAVLREPRASWPFLGPAHVDPNEGDPSRLLSTPLGPVGICWAEGQPPPQARVVWAPRVWVAGEGGVPAASLHARALSSAGARVVVRSCLGGVAGRRLLDRGFQMTKGAAVGTLSVPAGRAFAWRSTGPLAGSPPGDQAQL